jgi:hypothetical protein
LGKACPYPDRFKHTQMVSNGAGPEALRGGSWNNNQRNARVSYRNNNHPDNFNNNIGFRVVVAPDFQPVGKAVALRRPAGRKRKTARSGPGRVRPCQPPDHI